MRPRILRVDDDAPFASMMRRLAGSARPKIVVLSGRDEPETEAFNLTKPLGSSELVQTLRRELGQ